MTSYDGIYHACRMIKTRLYNGPVYDVDLQTFYAHHFDPSSSPGA